MSFKDKVKSLLSIDEEDFFDEEFEVPTMEAPAMNSYPTNVQPVQTVQFEQQQRPTLRTVEQPKPTNSRGQVSVMNANDVRSKVIIREPKDYSDAQNIADCLKESLPVFVNLQRLDKGLGRRVIDFLSGTIYAIEGEIKPVGNNLFLCTPKTVETDGSVTEDSSDELTLGEL